MPRRLHPRAANVRVKGRYELPQAAQSYQRVVQMMGVPLQFRFDVGLMVVEYNEGGSAWEKALYTVRSVAGELEKVRPIVSVILNSVQVNPAWVEGEIRGQLQRGEIAPHTQQEIARLDREIVEHRRRTNAEINNMMYHNLMRTEEYVNPRAPA
jgi:hypothetical protein